MKRGDTVTLKKDRAAWYSGYGMNPVRTIAAGEPLTVTHVDVIPVRGRTRYNVANTADGLWQVSFLKGETA